MIQACNWVDPPSDISSKDWNSFSKVYTRPSDIDVFSGALAEPKITEVN